MKRIYFILNLCLLILVSCAVTKKHRSDYVLPKNTATSHHWLLPDENYKIEQIDTISTVLQKNGLINSKRRYKQYVQINGTAEQLKIAKHCFDILAQKDKPNSNIRPPLVTFPGFVVHQIELKGQFKITLMKYFIALKEAKLFRSEDTVVKGSNVIQFTEDNTDSPGYIIMLKLINDFNQ